MPDRPLPDPAAADDPLRSHVVRILRRHSYASLEPAQVRDDTPLLDDGLDLDSIGLVDTLLDIEAELQLELREEDLQDSAIATVGALVAHVRRKLGPGGPPP